MSFATYRIMSRNRDCLTGCLVSERLYGTRNAFGQCLAGMRHLDLSLCNWKMLDPPFVTAVTRNNETSTDVT
jgi:hypothetical protein